MCVALLDRTKGKSSATTACARSDIGDRSAAGLPSLLRRSATDSAAVLVHRERRLAREEDCQRRLISDDTFPGARRSLPPAVGRQRSHSLLIYEFLGVELPHYAP